MEEPRRFQCPPGFAAVPPAPPPGLWREALGRPGTELWLIRAPADFQPESLEGCAVPLGGCGRLRGAERRYGLRGTPGRAGSAHLLAPCAPSGRLACAPALRGALTISESFGGLHDVPIPEPEPEPSRKEKKKKKKERVKEEPPEPPEVLTPVKAEPGAERERGTPLLSWPTPREAEEAPEPVAPPKKKKKHKRKRETEDWGQTELPQPRSVEESAE
ncbi:DNA-directed RNA polymerase I subunit RPA34 [Struthio camelus]|uniref:DNA-directed RNA polymerase I subunit RPA34 n=1 Tax=Struthio camelus TaxID=8801 RepID=UPI0036042D47